MKPLSLSPGDRSTKEISPKFLQQVAEQIRGLAYGSLEIVVRDGYIIGFKFHQWRLFRPRQKGMEEEK